MDSKNNKMDQIQHTQSRAHVKAAAGQIAAVTQPRKLSFLAQPLIHSHTDRFTAASPTTKPFVKSKIAIQIKCVNIDYAELTDARVCISGEMVHPGNSL